MASQNSRGDSGSGKGEALRHFSCEMTGLAVFQAIVGVCLIIGPALLMVSESLSDLHRHWQSVVVAVLPVLGGVGLVLVAGGYRLWRQRWRWGRATRAGFVITGALGAAVLVAIATFLLVDTQKMLVMVGLGSAVPVCLACIGLLARGAWARWLRCGVCGLGTVVFASLALGFGWSAITWTWAPDRHLALALYFFCFLTAFTTILIIRLLQHPVGKQLFAGQDVGFGLSPCATDVARTRSGLGFFGFIWLLLILMITPDVLRSWDRGRMHESWSNMRAVMMGLEMHARTHSYYPNTESIESLVLVLELDPAIGERLPTIDGWGWPLGCYTYGWGFVVRSTGFDGKFEHDDPTAYTYGAGIGLSTRPGL